MVEIFDLRLSCHHSGLGVSAEPRVSWRYSCLSDESTDWVQTAYEIEIHRPSRRSENRIIQATSRSSVSVPWPDCPLESREEALIRVRAHGLGSVAGDLRKEVTISTPWSSWLSVEATLLVPSDWTASFITSILSPSKALGDGILRPIRLRKIFKLGNLNLTRARLYITALGLYVAYLNGKRIGDEHLAPGYTSYHHRIQYQVYNVTSMLELGCENVLAIEVAEGWYAGRIAWDQCSGSLYGEEIGAVAQLEMFNSQDNQPCLCIASDSSWESNLSPILASGIWAGETYDRRLETNDWNKSPQSNFPRWQPVKILPESANKLVMASAPGVKVSQAIKPIRVFQSVSGRSVVDFGQNIAGKILIHHLSRASGHRLQMRHVEVLENGDIAVRPLRQAAATDTIIFGEDDEIDNWSPHFTYHGFRFVEFDGWSALDETDPLTIESVSGLVMHTDMDRTGYFECSNDLLTKLHENIVWSMRSNFVSIPTDCPQRDERMGWTGDIQVFAPTAAFLFDCDLMLSNWMRDLILEQRDMSNVVPFVVPNCLANWRWPSRAQAVWDDVVVLLPWVLYTYFENKDTLRQSYMGMQSHLERSIPRGEDGLWDENIWQLGDWLDPNAPPQEPGLARTDGTLVADEYLVHVTNIMAGISSILGYTDDSKRYGDTHRRLTKVFCDKYMAPSGLIVGDSQTSLALALNFSLHGTVDSSTTKAEADKLAEKRENAANRLARLVRYAKFRVSTGFAGTPAVLHALSSTGNLQTAYRMLLEEECPSWLYSVNMGATTVWERWDSMLPDGSINPGTMTSFNHYALGAVANWIHQIIGGLAPLPSEPGWRKFVVQPRPGGNITSARIDFKSPCGQIKCKWEISDDAEGTIFRMNLVVPPNSTALVVLPCGSPVDNMVAGTTRLVGSGCYNFQCEYQPEDAWPPKALLTEFKEDV